MVKTAAIKKYTILVCAAFVLGGCSVDYGDIRENEDYVPELMLDEAAFCRTEKGHATTQVTSERIEEFKKSGKILAKEIHFETRDEKGKTTATGQAGIMYADTKNEVYEFYEGIDIESATHNVKISGKSLKWNGKTEQLVGERGAEISIEKDGISLHGHGFSASAVSEQFSFASNVSGTYTDKDAAPTAQMNGE